MKKLLYTLLVATAVLFTGCSQNEVARGEINTPVDENAEMPEGMEDIRELEAYVESFECGYVSEAGKINYSPMFITNSEELERAQEEYFLQIIEDDWTNNSIAEAFAKLTKEYSIDEYNYLIEYQETTSGGYYFHADKVGVLGDNIGFLLGESQSPSPMEATTEVMGGFCHMAAIPKAQTEGTTFTNVIYP